MPVTLHCLRCGKPFRLPPVRVPTARYCSIACRAADKVHTADDFWARVDRNGPILRPELGPCWLWTGARMPRGGYGELQFQRLHTYAHRVAYMLAHGPIPDGLF